MKYKIVSSYGVSSPADLPWYVKWFGRKHSDGSYSWKYNMYLPYTKEWQWQEEHQDEYMDELRREGIIL